MKIPALDGVRGIAIILVLVSHLQMILGSNRFLAWGWTGVDLFFVLSGYLITRKLMEGRSLARFYGRRMLRIWPLYIVFIAVAFLATRQAFPWPYALLLQNVLPSQETTFTNAAAITWSLCIEEHFYLVWPLLTRFVAPCFLVPGLVLAIVSAPFLRIAFGVTQSPVTWFHFDAIAAGCLLAFAEVEWVMAGLGGLLVGGPFLYTGLAFAFCGLTQWAIAGRSSFLFTAPFLMRLGKISYGLYLIHYLVFLGCRHLPNAALGAALALAISYCLAEISYRYFEQPILNAPGPI